MSREWKRSSQPTGTDEVVFYCNPDLAGARVEKMALTRHLGGRPLAGVRRVGQASPASLGVVATHADAAPGLRQALLDHRGDRLLAGECLLRQFPRTVVLGSCHGYGTSGSAGGDHEPIGLLTVISARGATWTIGGHQEITDGTSAWVLSRAYAALAAGTPLHDALREAQLAFLAHADDVESGRTPPEDFPRLPEGDSDLSAPWHWALTIVGPPAPASP